MRIVDIHGSGGSAERTFQEPAAKQQQTIQTAPQVQAQEKENEAASEKSSTSVTTKDLEQLWQWNENVPPLLQRCMHSIITEQAAKQPDAVAVQSWDGSLTYAELNQLSTRLAGHLVQNKGVTVGTRIPLCFEKSMWALVGLLGVMKAGATFCLTDPSQPEARLQTIVEQTGARIVVTSKLQSELGSKIAGEGEVIAVSREFLDILEQGQSLETVALPFVPPSSPMYVIFTSGSTGKPKGVVISHENYTSGAIPRAEAVGYQGSTRCFDFPSYAFDVSIDCMLCTLALGGRVCVPSEEERMNDLSGAIRRSKANMVHMTPSVARVLDSDIIPSLDYLGLGGEAVSSSDAAAWGQHTNLVIAYGPSECTVGCTINNKVLVSTGIGWGVGGVTWIVDPEDHNRLTPVGEVGELIIEGPVVGIGYLDEPEKTAEVFIENPTWLLEGYGNISGRHGRLYKTGDLVKYEDNGSGLIEFVGRKDQQVKLRGQRVELAEVEHHLQLSLPAGVKVAAEVIKPENGAPSLIAFLSECSGSSTPPASEEIFTEPSPELEAAISNIDSTMGARVPRYMVPAAFITLAEMPFLVSRKIDRKKLRQIGASIPREKLSRMQTSDVEEEEPETPEEKQLQAAWVKVLGSNTKAYRQSNFFHLGGDSLRAMRLIAAAREEGLLLTVADVFTNPLLSDMARKTSKISQTESNEIPPFSLLEKDWDVEAAKKEVAALCNINPEVVEDVYPCTPLQEALMALSAKVKEAYVAQRVVNLDSQATADKLISAFDVAQNDCSILRTRIVQVPGRGLMQVVVKGKLNWFAGTQLNEYLVSDRDEAMDLGKPLVRYAVINEQPEGQVSFVLTMHHALYDGWSMPIVVDRINKAYQREKVSRPAEFKHFIQYLLNQDRSLSEKYWKELLEGANGPQFPSLPFKGYQTQADSLLEVYVPLEHQTASSTTTATIIRGAWAFVASKYINTPDIIFGETLTGRNAPIIGAEEIEGPMITTIPVRVQVYGDSTVAEYLQEIQEQTVSKIPHEHFGLQHIRRLSPDALEACELRTGLVLHPSAGDEQPLAEDLPANRLVPAGDDEAAQEALKFNTYALMLVCSIDPKGFLVMASFDSKTISKPIMERALQQLKQVSQQLCEKSKERLENITYLAEKDEEEIRGLSQSTVFADAPEGFPATKSAYIVNPKNSNVLTPVGGIGEVILCSPSELELKEIQAPSWAVGQPEGTRFYRTEKLAKSDLEGKITFANDSQLKTDTVVDSRGPRKYLSATSRKQRKLRSIWSRVLRVPEDDIGLNDSFFHIGGDSIAAMKLVSEARVEGIVLTVVQVFNKRTLYDMANVMEEHGDAIPTLETVPEFSLLGIENTDDFVEKIVRPQLSNPAGKIVNVLPSRPLQEIAVKGTVQIPRFSARYELMYFDGIVDRQRIMKSCRDLVARNEILRTVFVQHEGESYAAVLEELEAEFVEYEIDSEVEEFAKKLCQLDVLTKMPLGSAFVKWFLIKGGDGKQSCLIFRISHAQYDEICLPVLLRQLSALYEGQPVKDTIPFSAYVGHVLRKSIPNSVPYWKDLLQGSSITILKPDTSAIHKKHFAIERSLDISTRPREITAATLPTAAWALCLARRLSLRDVTFGEVVSGRNIDFPNADTVVGPCWQYIPVRVKFDPSWTGLDLLDYVQHQHIASSAHESLGLKEIVKQCTDWSSTTDWFDTVVHQDVEHVESLGLTGTASRMETVYLHEEPLKEWKIQAFFQGDKLTLEIVTIDSWSEYAHSLLDDLVGVMQQLVQQAHTPLFE
ncbi:unnamed protein product [Clonostachys chloroleuca]|uniref:Brevianamide F synthase n=1 Tax=Clonostachys chloroleuca TaxID=1926264 RepID=A0AA35MDY0_9HYPO|nr:unnamed protein product [Clonostachys chloroleuca]